MILEKIRDLKFLTDFNWDVSLIPDDRYNSDLLEDFEEETVPALEILVVKANLKQNDIELSFALPITLNGVKSVNIMQLLMKPIFKAIQVIIKDSEDNRIGTLNATLSEYNYPDWHIDLQSETNGILKFVAKYHVEEWEVF